MSNEGKIKKSLHLDEAIIKTLAKLAVDSPQKNFKNYAEQILIDIAMIEDLKKLHQNQ